LGRRGIYRPFPIYGDGHWLHAGRAAVAGAGAFGGAAKVTISLGVSELSVGCETIDQAIENADRLLYLAKSAGRNRVGPRSPSCIDMFGAGISNQISHPLAEHAEGGTYVAARPRNNC